MKIKVKCDLCHKPIEKEEREIRKTKHNFCSSSHAASYLHIGQPSPKAIERTCKICKSKFFTRKPHRSKSFCSSCLNGGATRTEYYKSLTLAQIRSSEHLKGHHPSWIYAQVRGFNRVWNKTLLKSGCKVCGYALHVELCHRRALSDFPSTATLGEVNDPSNLIPLCRNHHWEFDNGFLVL